MTARLRFRKLVSAVMLSLTGVCAFVAVSVLLFILGYLAFHGGRSLNWDFFTKLPTPVGEAGGGMANAIVGSAKLLLLASLVGVPIGFLGGVYLAEFGGRTMGFVVPYVADLLNGVPSIVIGIFAYSVVVLPFKHFSTLAGGLALGASHWRTIATVVVPAAYRGILTAVLLAVARVAGETAPLLFTAFSNRFWSSGWSQPTASLPVMIYTYAIAPYEDWHRQAWAAGAVLLSLVLLANVLARAALARGISAPRA